MNSKIFFILMLIIAGIAVFGFTTQPKGDTAPEASLNSQVKAAKNTLTAQSKTMGVVSVEVTPASLEKGQPPVFDVEMNNHSVDLDYDYTKIATLTNDQGESYKPIEWTGNSSGHHVKGQLIFPTLSTEPQQLKLTLEGVDNETEDFSWQL